METTFSIDLPFSVNWTPALEAMQDALMLIQDTWEQAVLGSKLPGMTRSVNDQDYASSLKMSVTSALQGEVSTDYPRAQRIENGGPPYDMKPFLLKGPHHKTNKKGQPYSIIPFRHGTPKSFGQAGTPMPTNVYSVAKKLTNSVRGEDGSMVWGTNTGDMSGLYPQQSKSFYAHVSSAIDRSSTGISAMKYTHKASIYSNMYKIGQGRHTQYMTFRAVSLKSDPASWWYPATPPNPVREAVIQAVQDEVQKIIQEGWNAAMS